MNLHLTLHYPGSWVCPVHLQGVPKKICSFQACRNYIHLSVGSSYFHLMTLSYRKFAAVNHRFFPRIIFPAHFKQQKLKQSSCIPGGHGDQGTSGSDEVNQKTKVVHNHRFFLRIFFLTHFDPWKCLKKFWWVGWWWWPF